MADAKPKQVGFLGAGGERVPVRSDDEDKAEDNSEDARAEESLEEDESLDSRSSVDWDRRRMLCDALDIEGLPVFNVHDREPETLQEARALIDHIKEKYGFVEPDRGNLDDPSINWRGGRKPDYTIANLQYFLGKTKNHKEGSLEMIVENMVKKWEMEATHKLFHEWETVNHANYTVQANGGKEFMADEACWVGNYNWLLDTVNKDYYDNSKETFESSHGRFRYAFIEGFPWEVLEVFSGPPRVAFSWRHWAVFSGEYMGNKGHGQTVTMTGFGVILLEDMKVSKIEIFYKPDDFFEVLLGKREVQELGDTGAAHGKSLILKAAKKKEGGCPFAHSTDSEDEDKKGSDAGGEGKTEP
uniref:Pathogen-related protein n=1 Tax=Pseudictyota dubia TaxID=2749911 RepID=A0A7R9WFQ0_9STRA|mmetsp:Transcript_49007/g.90815  ORF Transcript_49007/g.90815 Transcript_49007/m.90815 type:complete len:357 (+) Transcript_49007:136-1206(+)|eukprot:CAMPEP_0197458280 /NCGR_PEP_ID=MMETSP1175-20131217/48218_1 /TAXON_ID=1003142 /ORGANISM="Triceratium dubium, Strain CCMP147" /LENGTH=356 /DNA_ID=CAMNT_0042992877 /DNA_START=136 /DNA_END=1206 /DNA_ORIENTATION=-